MIERDNDGHGNSVFVKRDIQYYCLNQDPDPCQYSLDGKHLTTFKNSRKSNPVYTVLPGTEIIDDGAFAWMPFEQYEEKKGVLDIKYILLPEGLKEIGNDAFVCSNFKSFTIPHSVERLGSNSFNNLHELKNISTSKSMRTIESNTFSFCDHLSHVFVNEGVTHICKRAFEGCYIESIDLPSSTEYVDEYALPGHPVVKIRVCGDKLKKLWETEGENEYCGYTYNVNHFIGLSEASLILVPKGTIHYYKDFLPNSNIEEF